MNPGWACRDRTWPVFPVNFSLFYRRPPGSAVSTVASRALGGFIRPLRKYTNHYLNREVRWDVESGGETEDNPVLVAGHQLYDIMRRATDRSRGPADVWGKRPTERTNGD